MKVFPCACLLGLAIFSRVNAVTLSSLVSPVTRVVKLLTGLSEKVESEGKKEKDLYETYVCWGKSVVEQKEASNSAAESRIQELETYIADLDAGRITLTSERADLTKEIDELDHDIETAKAMREKEHHDFVVAEAEMKAAIKALDSAIETLDKATKDHKGALLGVRQRLNGEERVNGGMEAFASKQASLMKAVELGRRSLTKADSFFLERALLGDVPSPDWKKLNRKATFKMSYKARSGKIQDLLKKMKVTFEENLKEAQNKEADEKEEYDKLSTAKNGQLDAARTALEEMNVESGARGLSKQDASDEVDALKEQVEADKKIISDTESALETKKKEYSERDELRSKELEAISEAISILHSDDARDLFKKSMASQSFLQISTSSEQKATNDAIVTLRNAARKSGDARLLDLAATLSSDPTAKERLKPVIEAIDKMLAMLDKEETEDLEIKQTCEEDRMSETRKASLAGREIDELTDKAVKLDNDAKQLEKDIEGVLEEQKKVEGQLKDAKRIRDDDHADWKVTDKEDNDAAALVKQAKDLLQKFYSEHKAALLSKRAPEVEAGKAPPPPPPTWEGGYKVQESDSKGIMAMLDLIHDDILKDQKVAKTAEDAAQKEYDEFEKTSDEQMKSLKEQEDEKEKVKGTTIQDKLDTEKARSTKKDALDGSLDIIKANNPKCEFFEVNYVMRVKNRQIETDGLLKAKAILEGASFSSAANLLQGNRK